MRRPLRRQILLPMLTVTLAALVGASVLNAWLSTRRTLREIEALPFLGAESGEIAVLSGGEFSLFWRR
jgi:hypothetical protein